MNLTELETHYEVNLIVDDLFSKQDWKDLNDDSVQDLSNRVKIAEAILSGKLTIRVTELGGTLEEFGYY